MALVLWISGTLLTKTGESMGLAGSSLKENAVKNEDRVVQRMKLTTSSEALRTKLSYCFHTEEFLVTMSPILSLDKFFAHQQLR